MPCFSASVSQWQASRRAPTPYRVAATCLHMAAQSGQTPLWNFHKYILGRDGRVVWLGHGRAWLAEPSATLTGEHDRRALFAVLRELGAARAEVSFNYLGRLTAAVPEDQRAAGWVPTDDADLSVLQDADQIVAECKDLIEQHSLDVAVARNVIAKGMLGDQPLPLK